MCFVDGENVTIRGQAFAASCGLPLVEGPHFRKDTYLWLPGFTALSALLYGNQYGSSSIPVRQYYYTSQVGDEPALVATREALRALGFDPQVFKKLSKSAKAKGVDLALAKDLLSHAFRGNYDVAFLFAGDADYVPLLEEVKRLGKLACVCFFESEGLNPSLRMAADRFIPLDGAFQNAWAHG